MRRTEWILAVLLLIAGLGWLFYKGEYLSLDISRSLKLLLIAPAPALMIVASFVAFLRWPQRFGGSLLGVGTVAGYWSTLEPRQEWAFPLIGADPALKAVGALFVPVGLVILLRRPILAGFLVGLGVWLGTSVSLSPLLTSLFGGGRRYWYYYHDPLSPAALAFDIGVPALIVIGGIASLFTRTHRGGADSASLD